MPLFDPVRVRGGRYGLRRLVRHRGRAVAAGLAVTAAALIAAAPGSTPDPPRGAPARGHPVQTAGTPSGSTGGRGDQGGRNGYGGPAVTVPVRLADAATARLLRPGDRVDVIAVDDPARGARARVVARGAQVRRVPRSGTGRGADTDVGSSLAPEPGLGGADGEENALVMLAVPRTGAVALAQAAATARLAVILW
ncbi:RcpC/CpaB family pilus assembly protein [Streptomyces mexicanus]|uniref:RcpC/CpaB family pilus assembly protein n=1 Tax=Streptomyces mexicanus TaxID=178566 RepID=UPI00363B76FB